MFRYLPASISIDAQVRVFALSYLCIAHPEELNHGIRKGKTPVRYALSGMLIWRSLAQTEPNKFFSFEIAWGGTGE